MRIKIYYEAKLCTGWEHNFCIYIPGFQRQKFKHVSKCNWIQFTRFKWNPRTYTCYAKFESEIRKCRRIPLTVSGFRNLFVAEVAYAFAELKSKGLTIVSRVQEQILRHWLTKSMDVTILGS